MIPADGHHPLPSGGHVVVFDGLPVTLRGRDLAVARVEAEALLGVWLDVGVRLGAAASCRLREHQPTHRIVYVDLAGRERVELIALDGDLADDGASAHERDHDFGSPTWLRCDGRWSRTSAPDADDWHEPMVVRTDALVDPRTWAAHPDYPALRAAIVAQGIPDGSHGLWLIGRGHTDASTRRTRLSGAVVAALAPLLAAQCRDVDLEHREQLRVAMLGPDAAVRS